MVPPPGVAEGSEHHWDAAYGSRGARGVSWSEDEPRTSLQLIDALSVDRHAPVIDVGGGASRLVHRLIELGYDDLTVLDISSAALDASRDALPADAPVTWIHDDVLAWHPLRNYGLWHDRALFHFLVDPDERSSYLARLRAAVAPGGAVILATFAPDGPDHCSGLPVARYAASELAAVLPGGWRVVEERREVHVTPAGVSQPFTWIAAFRARSSDAAQPG
jgi:trans-aconitate methyltransferase